jgi:UDP-N-acetylglucosamine acyltransferase
VVIGGNVDLGDDNWIGTGTVIGSPPEVRSFSHDKDWIGSHRKIGVRIGNSNVIRESVQVHAGWKKSTILGNTLFIMNQAYIAHDCELLDGVTLASSVTIGGHARLGVGANVGLGTAVHQGRVIGPMAMVGMSSVVTKDLPPFVKAFGNPCRVRGINVVGLQRAGFGEKAIVELERRVKMDDYPGGSADLTEFSEQFAWFAKACQK